MVAKNPIFSKWTAKKFAATVIDDIWPEVLLFTAHAAVIVIISETTTTKLGVSNQLLTVLGLVLGLVISFRTSSAYERYQEGRKLWTSIIVMSKHMAQMIWLHVPTSRPIPEDSPEGTAETTELEAVLEKKTMINLVQAFAVSVKHFLRGEQGVYYEDLYPLISFLPKYANKVEPKSEVEPVKLPLWHLRDQNQHLVDDPKEAVSIVVPETEPMLREHSPTRLQEPAVFEAKVRGHSRSKSSSVTLGAHVFSGTPDEGYLRPTRRDGFDPECSLPLIPSEFPLRPARNPPESSLFDMFPLLKVFRWIWRKITFQKLLQGDDEGRTKRRRRAYAEIVESHVPLEIYLVLSNYSNWLMKKGLVQSAIATSMTNTLYLLQDVVANLERICNTPLPFAYQAHLRISLWLYLTLLPFQIYPAYRWITIPATAFASFLLLGFLEIGQEIENPFNYDLNDLDLDYFCLAIQRDLHEITTHTNPEPHDFIFTRFNQPLAPADRRHAEELTRNKKEYTPPAESLGDAGQGYAEDGMEALKRTLVSSWKTVDTVTRQ